MDYIWNSFQFCSFKQIKKFEIHRLKSIDQSTILKFWWRCIHFLVSPRPCDNVSLVSYLAEINKKRISGRKLHPSTLSIYKFCIFQVKTNINWERSMENKEIILISVPLQNSGLAINREATGIMESIPAL